jgi:hypothetical protein
MVYTLTTAQQFYLYDSSGNQINSGLFNNAFQIAQETFFYVPGNLYVASGTFNFLWVKYSG